MGQAFFKDWLTSKEQVDGSPTVTPKNKKIIKLDVDPRSPGIGRTPLQVCVRGSDKTPDTPTSFK